MADSGNLSSLLWEFFTINNTDETKAVCNYCNKSISRGGKDKHQFGLSGIKKHLSTHGKIYSDYQKRQKKIDDEKLEAAAASKKSDDGKQLSLEESFIRFWDINMPQSQAIIKKIAEFIVLDQQPISVVDDTGFIQLLKHLSPKFKCPGRRYFSDVIIPKMYDDVKTKIGQMFDSIDYMAFTCDIWTARSLDSYCSLTSHYIDDKYHRQECVLACSYFPSESSIFKPFPKILVRVGPLPSGLNHNSCFNF